MCCGCIRMKFGGMERTFPIRAMHKWKWKKWPEPPFKVKCHFCSNFSIKTLLGIQDFQFCSEKLHFTSFKRKLLQNWSHLILNNLKTTRKFIILAWIGKSTRVPTFNWIINAPFSWKDYRQWREMCSQQRNSIHRKRKPFFCWNNMKM